MKALIFILLFAPLFGLSQMDLVLGKQMNVFAEWRLYINDCNTLVSDIVIQSGTVNVEYKPVMADGKISHFILAPIDTVWQKIECRDFKYDDSRIYWGGNVGIGTSLINYSTMTTLSTIYSTPEAKSKISITRKKICQIKKRKASWEDFWNHWCKEKKIIEFN